MQPLTKQAGRFYGLCERRNLGKDNIQMEYRIYEKKMRVRFTPDGQRPIRIAEFTIDQGWAVFSSNWNNFAPSVPEAQVVRELS